MKKFFIMVAIIATSAFGVFHANDYNKQMCNFQINEIEALGQTEAFQEVHDILDGMRLNITPPVSKYHLYGEPYDYPTRKVNGHQMYVKCYPCNEFDGNGMDMCSYTRYGDVEFTK